MAGDEGTRDRPTREAIRRIWDVNAAHWDPRIAGSGSWQRTLIFPAVERLLELRPGEAVLEIACGNGLLAQRMAESGARVLATDVSDAQLSFARQRTTHAAVGFRRLDASDPKELSGFGGDRFDAVVATMALMDMLTVEPLAHALPRLLRPGGRFVFAVAHPAFNNQTHVLVTEVAQDGDDYVERHAVKVYGYARPKAGRGIGVIGQPELQWYFDRSLSDLLGPFLVAGLALDGLEEPVFDEATAAENEEFRVWVEIPPVLVGRLRAP